MELMGEVTRETTSPSLQRGVSGNVTICDSQNVEKGISKMHQFTWNHCNCNHRELCWTPTWSPTLTERSSPPTIPPFLRSSLSTSLITVSSPSLCTPSSDLGSAFSKLIEYIRYGRFDTRYYSRWWKVRYLGIRQLSDPISYSLVMSLWSKGGQVWATWDGYNIFSDIQSDTYTDKLPYT